MTNPPNETIEILKIIVPAVSAFLGILIAGLIGYYSSTKTSKKIHLYNIERERLNRFTHKITSSIEIILSILISNLKKEQFNLSSTEKQTLIEYSVWIPKEIADKIDLLVSSNENSIEKADLIIESIRNYAGIE